MNDNDDDRIWQGLRAHLDDMGRLAPAPDIERVRASSKRERPRPGRAVASLGAVALVALGSIWIAGQLGLLGRPVTSGSSPSPSGEIPAVHIVNVDGPVVDLLVDNHVIATLACGGSTATFVPGTDGLPALPWELIVRSTSGAVLGSPTLAGPLPQGVLIRGTNVLTGPWPVSYGPAPAACTVPSPTPTVIVTTIPSPTMIPACVRVGTTALRGVVEARPAGWSDLGEISALADYPNTSGRVYGPEAAAVPPDEGPGRIALYETFPASSAYFESRIEQSRSRGATSTAAMVCGEATEVWQDASTGELVIGWTDRDKGEVLVANTADYTLQQLVDSAERVYDCCG